MQTIAAEEVLERMRQGLEQTLIDVRSEYETAQGRLPNSCNLPILTQSERHSVGICYKERGQEAAIELGHQLVDPLRPERVAAWRSAIKLAQVPTGLVMCWRGGLRSQIACQWLAEAGVETERVMGGYKAIRKLLLEAMDAPRELILLGGMTGSGKTELLQLLSSSQVDLEAAAEHRGSAFGALGLGEQPAQASFENNLGWQLHRSGSFAVVEDESRMLGRLQIPENFFQKMSTAPLVMLEDSLDSRVNRIYREYVAEPLIRGIDPNRLHQSLAQSLSTLKRRLDRHFVGILQSLGRAFTEGNSLEYHAAWIAELLERYYDPRYRYALERGSRQVVFEGGAQACRDFIEKAMAQHKVSSCSSSV